MMTKVYINQILKNPKKGTVTSTLVKKDCYYVVGNHLLHLYFMGQQIPRIKMAYQIY